MNKVDSNKESISEFIEVLHLFDHAIRHDMVDVADEIIKYARDIIERLRFNRGLLSALTDKPDVIKSLVGKLLNYFHNVAEGAITRADNEHHQSDIEHKKIKLMWQLWPVLHRLLILQIDSEPDSEDYTEKAAELYGIITQAMESQVATKMLREIYEDVFPLPHG